MKIRKGLPLKRTAAGILAGALLLSGCQRQAADRPAEETVPQPETEQSSANIQEKEEGEESSMDESQPTNQIKVPSFSKEDFPKIDGSTATLPLSIALYRLSTGVSYKEAELSISHSKTTSSYYNLIYGNTSLVIAYEPDSSVFELLDEQGVQLEVKPIGKDALVFMANQGNPVTSLTDQQLVDIYSGKIKNWSEVEGDDKEIVAFQRPGGSGSQTLMEKLVMKGTMMDDAPTIKVSSEMGDLIEDVASYNNEDNALGYSVYFYARNMYQRPELRFMAVDGVMPDNKTIKDGSYPYVNEFYAAVRVDEPKDSPAYQLFTWLTTDDGQSLVEELGYVGVSEGSKQLSPDWKKLEQGTASISLKGSEYLLMSGMFVYNEPGTVIFSQDMQSVRFVKNISPKEYMIVASLDDPVVVFNENDEYGLYDFKENKWIVEPKYNYMYQNEHGYYETYTMDGVIELDSQGKVVFIEEEDKYRVGDYTWKVKVAEGRADVFDRNGNLVNQVDVSMQGIPSNIQVTDNHFVWRYESVDNEGPWKFVLCDEVGNVKFTKDDLSKDDLAVLNGTTAPIMQDMQCFRISLDGSWMEMKYATTRVIYDLIQKKVVTSPGDEIYIHQSIFGSNRKSYYIVTNGDDKAIYERPGVKMVDAKGIPYTIIPDYIGYGYMGYVDGNLLVIDDLNTKERTKITLEDTDFVLNNLAKGVFAIKYEEKESVILYQKDQVLDIGNSIYYDYYGHLDEYQVVRLEKEDGHVKYIFDTSGNIRYTSKYDESVDLAVDEFFVTTGGDYFQIMDYDGNVAVKMLVGHMGDD